MESTNAPCNCFARNFKCVRLLVLLHMFRATIPQVNMEKVHEILRLSNRRIWVCEDFRAAQKECREKSEQMIRIEWQEMETSIDRRNIAAKNNLQCIFLKKRS
jgi:hypothetical protein